MYKWTDQTDRMPTAKHVMSNGQDVTISAIFSIVCAGFAVTSGVVLAGAVSTKNSSVTLALSALFLVLMVVMTIIFFFQTVNAMVRYNVAKSSPPSSARVEP